MPNEAKEITEKREIAVTKLIDDAERMRQNSIYVDFDQALNVYGQPQNFVNNDYEKVRKDVILAKYHIDRLSGLSPNKDVLHSTFPDWKDELEESQKDLASGIADAKADG